MNLYLVTRKDNCDGNEYDSAVICADNEEDAASISPCYNPDYTPKYWNSNNLNVSLIGTASKVILKSVILSSFNAG